VLIGTIGLVVFGAILDLVGIPVGKSSGGLGLLIHYLTVGAAIVGLGLASLGTLGLLHRRLFDPELKDYTTKGDVFNLVFFLVVFAVAWLTFAFADRDFSLTRSFVQHLITFNVSAPIGSTLVGIEILLVGLLIAYIPMTHMSHFFIKWFTYHKVRWDDEPNIAGNPIAGRIGEQLQYPVTWSAPHIRADGRKTWADIATEEIE
jgi:nitrate reductase gamma subunit